MSYWWNVLAVSAGFGSGYVFCNLWWRYQVLQNFSKLVEQDSYGKHRRGLGDE